MRSDNRLLIVIFVALVLVVVGIPVLYHQVRQMLAPRLLEVRIVTATTSDPVFRDRPRHAAAGDRVEIAAALCLSRFGRGPTWLAPVGDLELGGEPVEHLETAIWPESNRAVRVFWFTVESGTVGGELKAEEAARRLHYRTFLAPEMGRSLRAAAYPQAHNEDQFGDIVKAPEGSGTIRLYARVEVYDPERETVPLQAVATAAAEHVLDPDYPAVYRSARIAGGIHDVVGELFNLPGFQPVAAPGATVDDVTLPAFGLTFTELVTRRFVTSSVTFAAVAATGAPSFPSGSLSDLGELEVRGGQLRRAGKALRWGGDVEPGDLLRAGSQWLVLVADDGDRVLDAGDTATWCWRSPPTLGTLDEGLPATLRLRLQRYGS